MGGPGIIAFFGGSVRNEVKQGLHHSNLTAHRPGVGGLAEGDIKNAVGDCVASCRESTTLKLLG